MGRIKHFLNDESGGQMAEYALLALLIALVVAATAYWLGGVIQDGFEAVVEGIDAPE